MADAKYPSIEGLQRADDLLLFEDTVIATEKIHGTNCRFGYVTADKNWFFRIGGRNHWYYSRTWDDPKPEAESTEVLRGHGMVSWVTSQPKLQRKFLDVWLGNNRFLPNAPKENFVVFGEFYGPGIQKGVTYRTDKKSFVAFDILFDDKYLDYGQFEQVAESLGLETVPTLYCGKISIEEFDKARELPSMLAHRNECKSVSEGIVVKPAKFAVNRFGHRLIAKYKNPQFTERVSERTPKIPIAPEILTEVTAFVDEFFTDNRWTHMCQLLETDQGLDSKNPRSIGPLIKLMSSDIHKESATERADSNIDWKLCAREISHRVRQRVMTVK